MVFKVCAHTLGGLAPHSYGPKLGVGPEKGRPQLPQLPSDSRLKLLVKGYNGRAGSSERGAQSTPLLVFVPSLFMKEKATRFPFDWANWRDGRSFGLF